MATLTPKLSLKKPVPNVEEDYGFRQNETIDILDDAMLTANVIGAGTVTMTDDGSGNVTISGAAGAGDTDTVSDALVGADGITVISGVPTTSETTVSGFRTEFVSASGSLQTQIDGASLTVKETDGSPLVTNVNTIIVTTGTLTDNGGGEVSIVTGGGAGGGSTDLQQAYDNGDGTIASTSAKPVQVGDLTATGTVLITGSITVNTGSQILMPTNFVTNMSPAYSFIAATGTGMRLRSDTNALSFQVAGAENLRMSVGFNTFTGEIRLGGARNSRRS